MKKDLRDLYSDYDWLKEVDRIVLRTRYKLRIKIQMLY